MYLQPAISYFDAYAGDLKITQSSGTSWAPKLLATQGTQGLYSMLTFDALDGPTVYYYNRTGGRVTRLTDSVSCVSASCTASR